MITDQWLEKIHQRIVDGDPTAPPDLAEQLLGPIKKILAKKWPNLPDPDLLDNAIIDAVLNYIKNPEQYKPDKRGIKGYLVMSAEGDLKNALKSYEQRKSKEISVSDVELLDSERKFELEDISDQAQQDSAARNIEFEEIMDSLSNIFPDPRDLEAAILILEGERSTSVFAEVLGINKSSSDQIAQEVKRHKDRLKKRLERWKRGES
jgi:RNA polymerase sigma-70 factor (ECF subfamily)